MLADAHPDMPVAWAKDAAETPSLLSPFWLNYSTIVLYEKACRVLFCKLYPKKVTIRSTLTPTALSVSFMSVHANLANETELNI